MVPDRVFAIINVSLGLITVLLLLSLLGVTLPTLGQAQYLLDKEDPLCLISIQDDQTPWNDLDRCCLEARKQTLCTQEVRFLENGRVDWVCGSQGNGYLLNNKAYNYCRQQPYW